MRNGIIRIMSLAKPTFGNNHNLRFSKLNLREVCTVSSLSSSSSSCSTPINPPGDSMPFFCKYQIDKYGELFGNTPYGVLNFTRYRVPIPNK